MLRVDSDAARRADVRERTDERAKRGGRAEELARTDRRLPCPRRGRARTSPGSDGACGAQFCHAFSTRAASDHGHSTWNSGDVARGMRLEGEVGHDPEVAASATAAGPEEIGVLVGVADARLTVRRHDRHLLDVVGGEAELPRRPAVSAAERKTRDPDGRARAAAGASLRCPELRSRRRSAVAPAPISAVPPCGWTKFIRSTSRTTPELVVE